jgi:hypothetical protein
MDVDRRWRLLDDGAVKEDGDAERTPRFINGVDADSD